jgi:hypothetical protein
VVAVRESRYKLVIDFSTRDEEFFDLQADPGELHPLPRGTATEQRRHLLNRARAHVADSVQLRDTSRRLAARIRDIRFEFANSTETVPA